MRQQNLGSDRDPSGTIFQVNERLLRGIRPEFAEYYHSVWMNPVFKKNLGSRIVGTLISDYEIPGYPLVFEHKQIAPPSYCYEWPLKMLQDAALLTLDLCLEFNQMEWVLKDATPWNILFDGPNPLFIDVTSIMPQDANLLWVAYDQFCRSFLFPLLLGEVMSGKASRAFLLYSSEGISSEEIQRYLPAMNWIRHPWLIHRLYFPQLVVDLLQKSDQVANFQALSQTNTFSTGKRRLFFEALKNDVNSIATTQGKSRWMSYYQDISSFFNPDSFNAKQKHISEILEKVKPASVIDIGCNQGGYAILAALRGSRVIAFDTDEECVASLYHLAKEKNLDILALIGDVLHPSPQSGWRGIEYPSAPNRFRSPMALALALVHHLAITHLQTFERIVLTLSEYCDQWLVTEFVPLDDPRSQELLLTNRRNLTWYTLENFLDALKQEFQTVETYPSFPEGRTLCFCQK